jgi:outer membrane receptor protein involved in Fe transport
LFVSDRLPLVDGLSAEIGLRYNTARVVLEDQRGSELNGDHRFHRLDPGIELDWDVSDSFALRAGFAQTGRVPTPAELSCADEAAPCSLTNFFVGDPPLKQVIARTWEAGASGRIGKVSWLLSAFDATNSDDIQLVSSARLGRAYFRNIGQTRRRGVEATADYSFGGLVLHAGYALTDATYRTALRLNSPLNPEANDDGTIDVAAGDRIPGVPRHRATLSADYGQANWSVGADVQAASGQTLFGDEANLVARTDGYIVAGITGSVTFGKVKLFGSVANLFNARYATFGTFSSTDDIVLSEAPGATDPRSLGPAAPRRVKLGLTVTF